MSNISGNLLSKQWFLFVIIFGLNLTAVFSAERSLKSGRIVSQQQPQNSKHIYHEVRVHAENSKEHPNSVDNLDLLQELGIFAGFPPTLTKFGENSLRVVASVDPDLTENDAQKVIVNTAKELVKGTDAANKVQDDIVEAVEDTGTDVGSWFTNLWQGIQDTLHKFVRVLEVIGLIIVAILILKLYRMASEVYQFFKGIFSAPTNTVLARNSTACTVTAESVV
ncbi:unnamed protein product [Orchesella dallaii]|uniref:Uncharacterized protein n=1 Tax=Orchesella dallaii TaxID=48710 RepID=A0ABP1QZD1_9HEXA